MAPTRPAAAEEWPTRPLTLVVPFAAGGPVDTIARIFGAGLAEQLGQQIVIEDQGGAGGMIAAARVAKSEPDGYTVLMGGSAVLTQVQNIYKKPLYDGAKDFTLVAMFADSARILITRKDFPASTLTGFRDYVKANAGKLQYGSSGTGAGGHVCALLLDGVIGTKMTHVPYRGAALVIQDMMAGRIDYTCEQVSTASQLIDAGSLKAIAVMGPDRIPVLPDVPTALEAGISGLDCNSWSALALPKGVPAAIVAKLAKATSDAVDAPLVKERFAKAGVTVPPKERRTPEYLEKFTPEEIKRWAKALSSAGVSVE